MVERLAVRLTHAWSFLAKPVKTEASLCDNKYLTSGPNHLSSCCNLAKFFLEMFKGCKIDKSEGQEAELGVR